MKVGDPKAAPQLALEHISMQVPTTGATSNSPEAIRQVAQTFESLFINEIMKNMRKTLPRDGLLNKGFANNVFNSMLDQEYSQIAARSGQFGLADAIARQLGSDPSELAQRQQDRIEGSVAQGDFLEAEEAVVTHGDEEVPTWALEEIQADPWTPRESQVNPQSTQQVTPGLSIPYRSEFNPATPASTELSPRATQRAQQAYQALTEPSNPSTSSTSPSRGSR